jgi:hypothetical protein
MIVGLTYVLTSLMLAFILPRLHGDQSHEQVGESAIYRYSKKWGKLFLIMIPVMTAIMFSIWFTDPHPPHGIALIVSSAIWAAMVGVPVFGYEYAARYRIIVDNRGVTVVSLFRVRRIEFANIGEIATVRGRGVDYYLFSPDHKCLAKLGGSVDDFDSLKDDVEHATRSSKVMLYNLDPALGWQERMNEPNDMWRDSKGPRLLRDGEHRANIMMVIGGLLIGLLFAYIHFYLR